MWCFGSDWWKMMRNELHSRGNILTFIFKQRRVGDIAQPLTKLEALVERRLVEAQHLPEVA
jgi:hypothetical protein